ncbi:MAG: hypothetical protein LC750_18720 [Actinobacteria bacterium]|nr:hypothetical protein [Actinomycetota bacterium]
MRDAAVHNQKLSVPRVTLGDNRQCRGGMMDPNPHRVRTMVRCGSGHDHELCVQVRRGVPPELRCSEEQPTGWSFGGGGCPLPKDLVGLVERELRDHFQECRRRGYVLVAA